MLLDPSDFNVMTAYTFFFNAQTFEAARERERMGVNTFLEYIAGKNSRPMKYIQDGDELFVVGIREGRVVLAGRLVADGGPVDRLTAQSKLGRSDLIEKDLYLIGRQSTRDQFRTDLFLTPEQAAQLELINSDGRPTNSRSLREGPPDPNLFRSHPRLSEGSAQMLRSILGLGANTTERDEQVHSENIDPDQDEPSGADDEAFRAALIRGRRGQPKFRRRLLEIYGRRCQVTGCGVEELLEAAHITPHAEKTDYAPRNGLLLRADIHTLFDLNLIGIDENYRIRVHEQLRNSEYWRFNDRVLDRFPPSVSDNPDRGALQRRLERWKSLA